MSCAQDGNRGCRNRRRAWNGGRLGRLLLAVFVPVLAVTFAVPATAAPASTIATVRVIVRLHDLERPVDVRAVARGLVAPSGGRVTAVYEHAVQGFAAEVPGTAARSLAGNPLVAAVTPDRIVTIAAGDPEVPTGIDRIEGDRNVAAAPVDVDIAIIDTGVETHPDLNLVSAVDCTPWSGLFGCVSDNQGAIHWHGNHVAGIAAARDDGVGVEGAAPGARIWSVRVLNAQGSGSLSQIIQGVDWVTARAGQIEVANMSLGGEFSDSTFDAAISNSVAAGVVYAVAAGNSASDSADFSPASHPDVITVSAIADSDGQPGATGGPPSCRADGDDTFADFSNYGAAVDVAAPGVCIVSTYTGGGYATASGTSMAAPHVAGVLGRYLAHTGIDPTSAADVAVVRAAVVGAALPQAHACGFTGDPDPNPEPLVFLNASVLGGSGSCGTSPPAADAPVVTWETPAEGATVAGSVEVAALVADADDGADGLTVELRSDGGAWQPMSLVGGDRFAATWNSTTADDGASTLEIRATDSASNETTTSREVRVDNLPNLPPAASFVADCSGLTCTFDGSASTDADGSITSYAWDFGDGASGTGATTSHTYAAGGTPTVTLTVTDDEAAADTAVQSIVVVQPTTMELGDVWAELAGKRNNELQATVEVLSTAAPVVGATVSGYFEVNGSPMWASGSTGADGIAKLKGGRVRWMDFVTVFCVDSVTAPGLTLTTPLPDCVLVYP